MEHDIYSKYLEITDNQLIQMARGGDSEAINALMERYKTMVRAKARSYYIAGADVEDTIQEGMIGLYNAYASYDAKKDASFKTFAMLCVERAIVSAVRKATAATQIPLDNYVSIDGDEEMVDQVQAGLEDTVGEDPETVFLRKNHTEMLRQYAKDHLSPKELQVFELYLQGNSQSEIAKILGVGSKSVDNALSRIKGKLVKTNGKE